MQIKKKEVRRKILEAARKEFQEKSFRGSSMRSISRSAKVSTSNIYNYFKNKDEMFRNILRPLIQKIEFAKQKFVEFESSHVNSENSLKGHQELVKKVAEFVDNYRAEFKMLIFKSEGSSLGNYDDHLVDWFTQAMKNSFSQKPGHEIDEFLIHVTISVWINSVKEIIMHDIKGQRALNIAQDIMTFVFIGWQGVMEGKGVHHP